MEEGSLSARGTNLKDWIIAGYQDYVPSEDLLDDVNAVLWTIVLCGI